MNLVFSYWDMAYSVNGHYIFKECFSPKRTSLGVVSGRYGCRGTMEVNSFFRHLKLKKKKSSKLFSLNFFFKKKIHK